jgi:hypothetical protein
MPGNMQAEPMVNGHRIVAKMWNNPILSSCHLVITGYAKMAIDVKHQFSRDLPSLNYVGGKPIHVVS